MLNSVVLGVVIGLVFVYLLYSLLATIIQEMIATWFSFRSKNLKRAITRMLEDGSKNTSTVSAFYEHPIIKFLGESEKNKNKPAYIKAETFSKVMIDLLKGNAPEAMQPAADARSLIHNSISTGMIAWKSPKSKAPGANKIEDETILYLRSIWADSQGDIDKFRSHLENWFDETMDRASGWYKKRVQRVLFFIGFAIAALFNVNTIDIAQKLEKDPELRKQMIEAADGFMKAHPDLDQELEARKQENQKLFAADSNHLQLAQRNLADQRDIDSLRAKQDTLLSKAQALIKTDIANVNHVLSLGWENPNPQKRVWYSFALFSFLGWGITALAISLGAPFWFDLLNKLMQLRSSVASKTAPEDQKNQPKQSTAVNRKG